MTTDTPRGNEQGEVRGAKMAGYPDFGRAMMKEFQFEEGCKSPDCDWLELTP